jgi:hypothetical protein
VELRGGRRPRKVDIGVRRRSHPLKRVVQVEVSFRSPSFMRSEGERHHYPTLPDAAFHEVARDSLPTRYSADRRQLKIRSGEVSV